ncbi:GapPol polyprotein [Acanthamoeba castellanii str. Neff]|uniref:GapPol polyprotein n=1 Tax=Acanthamoeba castellanii (strain ATCC 30010 / Neff) TaxID=1257118 RepID=L8GPK1_ACACF|nr:GapPol polyprotein [Acanthamoeba castellanii str. Neff]ELR14558.1 GapPol polyprotein [Acanthamoeba castellanii str. Neff]
MEQESPMTKEEVKHKELSISNVRQAQRKDPELQLLINYLEQLELPDDPKLSQRIVLEARQMGLDGDGILHHFWWMQRGDRRTNTRCQLVVPAALVETVMAATHDDLLAGHFREKRTIKQARQHYWWRGMFSQIKRWVATCLTCQQCNNPKGQTPGLLQSIPAASQPFQQLRVDLIGPLPQSRRGNKHILVFVDYLTKWPEAYALPDATAEAMAHVYVKQVICRHGAPEALLSNHGKQFLSEVVRHVNEYLQVHKVNTTPYHPQTDSLVERFNGTLESLLTKFRNNHQDNWDDLLPYALSAYRTSVHEATGDTPFYLLYGRDPYLPVDITSRAVKSGSATTPERHKSELVDRLRDAYAYARANQERAQQSDQRAFDHHWEQSHYYAGDKVWLRAAHLPRGKTAKLARMWKGPYRVGEVRGQLVLALQHVNNPRDQQVVSVRRVKPCQLDESLADFTQRLRNQQAEEPDDGEDIEVEAILNDRPRGEVLGWATTRESTVPYPFCSLFALFLLLFLLV